MSEQRLKIAYLCDFSPLDRFMYSGGNAHMYRALQRHAGEVTILSRSWGLAEPVRRGIARLSDPMQMRLRWRAHLALAPVIARKVRAELSHARYDVLFGTYAFHALHRVTPPYPLVTAFSSDATQTIYRNSEIGSQFGSKYPGGRAFDAWVERCEAEVFNSTDLMFWPSEWLKSGADARYGLDPERSLMVPWGAGIRTAPEVSPAPFGRGLPVRLLLIGRDWFAKGGPTAFDTMTLLRARGVDARLTVIGCQPPECHRNEWVTVHPQLDKGMPDEMAVFERVFAEAHFLVQPSYESYGFAFCEASAYKLPSLCLNVGGVPVRDGVNGHALPPESGPPDFAAMIERYLEAPDEYLALARSARQEFEDHLNWDAWGRTVAAHLRAGVARLHGKGAERDAEGDIASGAGDRRAHGARRG
ncbi:glycosyltransferase family 4 protein [Salipiger bermudensis]|uniref:glycosyltransferase family 4 protein n=1 Tax=Salipiger bermudensis TaxID=344736 RepID=UPI001CD77E69|nr:glycosyltransferase family 4 protein [Salipiger bermudensis]MCA0962660.1 glycosyltransferase family 4 protein [Salipiger bermudensis]